MPDYDINSLLPAQLQAYGRLITSIIIGCTPIAITLRPFLAKHTADSLVARYVLGLFDFLSANSHTIHAVAVAVIKALRKPTAKASTLTILLVLALSPVAGCAPSPLKMARTAANAEGDALSALRQDLNHQMHAAYVATLETVSPTEYEAVDAQMSARYAPVEQAYAETAAAHGAYAEALDSYTYGLSSAPPDRALAVAVVVAWAKLLAAANKAGLHVPPRSLVAR